MQGMVLIAGGGIGGLALGVALSRAGIDCAIHEQAGALREVGAGISLFSNALQALDCLGLAQRIAARGDPLEQGELCDARGRVLVRTRVGAAARRIGHPTVVLHRAELLAELEAALPSGCLRLAHAVVGFEAEAQRVRVRLADGSEASGALLIGADGLHSVVRAALHGPSQPRYAGYTSWRAIGRAPAALLARGRAFEAWGKGARFGAVRLDAERVYWFAARNTAEGGRDQDARAELLAHFRGWCAPTEELIESVTSAEILRHDLYDREPLATPWGSGRVSLLGDAAHPTTPNLGQGAALAIEDAVVLADCLVRRGIGAEALREYETRRAARARAIVLGSRRLGWVGQRERGWERAVRDTLMRWSPQGWMQRAFESGLRWETPAGFRSASRDSAAGAGPGTPPRRG